MGRTAADNWTTDGHRYTNSPTLFKRQVLNIKPKRILRPHTRIRTAKHNPAWKETKEEGDWEKNRKKSH